jgi:hypothetical protein
VGIEVGTLKDYTGRKGLYDNHYSFNLHRGVNSVNCHWPKCQQLPVSTDTPEPKKQASWFLQYPPQA